MRTKNNMFQESKLAWLLKRQAASYKPQAASRKQQASSCACPIAKLFKQQAASVKPSFQRLKLQAASSKLFYYLSLIKFHAARSEGLY